MSKRPGPNKANLEETRRVFIDIARTEFVEHGYAEASTSRIVEKSGMARGSLYYHFGDKNGIFRAVYEDMMQIAVEKLQAILNKYDDPWEAFLAGAEGYLDLCTCAEFRKIILLESQAAIPFEERFRISERTLIALLRGYLPALLSNGQFPGHTPRTFTIYVYGLLQETGRAFDFSENLEEDREIFGKAFVQTMNSMRHPVQTG